MSTLRTPPALAAAILVLISIAPLPLSAATAAPDANLYTSYYFSTGYQTVNWIVCGSTQETEGCYEFGSLGPFGAAGALIEGNPSTNAKTSTVTRYLYVVDSAAGSGTGVALNVYKKTDVVSSTFDTTTVTFVKTVSLPLTGGTTAICSMAANNGYLFIGTNQSPIAVRVTKSNLTIEEIGAFEPPINVTSITSDKYGFVTVTYGDPTGGDTGLVQFAPDGNVVGDGGGAWYMLSTDVALTTATLPTSDALPADRLQVRPKKSAKSGGAGN
jgi:hypothetical protein